MAATAYASLVSLLNTIDQIHTHPLVSTFFDINQNKSLSKKVNFLVDFVEKYSDADSREVEDLVRRIGDAAHQAEDIMEVHAADRVRGRESPSFLHDLQMIIEKMDSMEEEVIKAKEETGKSPSFLSHLPLSSLSSSSSSTAPSATDEATTMVGFGDDRHKLLDELLGHDVDRQIISITGMGGIGKTTLARNSYENSLVVSQFNVRAWITVSQDSSATKVFLQALSCLGADKNTVDDQQLSVKLHQALFNRRYLIVLDDVWSVEIWNQIKLFFPDNKNGSRIIVTTRDSKLIDCIGSSALPLKFLDEENSWKLFCDKAFPQQSFDPELVKVGKKIVKKCGGLPLAISVIGGLLGKSPSSQGYWKRVAKDRSLILNSAEENKPSDILYLSYKYLPLCLKPCFLYLGLYPEDSWIEVPKLIKICIAEGFIKANRDQSLEEVAETYINELIDRNLLLLHHHYGTLHPEKTCSTHDLVRDLCIKIGEEENFYYVPRSIDGNRHFIADQTKARFCFQESNMPSIFNPIIVPQESRATTFKTRLLRVLYCGRESPYYDALQEVNMRYLKYRSSNELVPSLLSRLWSLQTLIVAGAGFKPPVEIWEMPQLRHIHMQCKSLPDPPPPSDDGICVLQNLQTLKTVKNLIFTEEVCKRIPNIKLLYIHYQDDQPSGTLPSYHLENLGCFKKLESLAFECYIQRDFLPNIKFPNSLKELRLIGGNLEWDYMSVIASLPHLQSLDIVFNAIATTEWVFTDEKFASLKHLLLCHCHVTKWIAQHSNFPVLETLFACGLDQLDEIPSGIGEITTLRSIQLLQCSKSAYISAVEILHEQQRFENFGLQVEIRTGGRENARELLREKIQELELSHVKIW